MIFTIKALAKMYSQSEVMIAKARTTQVPPGMRQCKIQVMRTERLRWQTVDPAADKIEWPEVFTVNLVRIVRTSPDVMIVWGLPGEEANEGRYW